MYWQLNPGKPIYNVVFISRKKQSTGHVGDEATHHTNYYTSYIIIEVITVIMNEKSVAIKFLNYFSVQRDLLSFSQEILATHHFQLGLAKFVKI